MKTLILLMSLLVASIASAEAGHTVGNGGGVICIRGVCKTLVEAGLQLSPQFNGVWIPEKIHYQDVEAKIKKTVLLPAQLVEDVHYRVFQRVDHFRKVDVVDPAI